MDFRPEENDDLTIRRIDGSFFKAALPTWFDQRCYMVQGDIEGNMRAVYIVPPMGAWLKLNPKTRKFERFISTEKEERIIAQYLQQVVYQTMASKQPDLNLKPARKNLFQKIGGMFCRK